MASMSKFYKKSTHSQILFKRMHVLAWSYEPESLSYNFQSARERGEKIPNEDLLYANFYKSWP